MKKNLKAKRYSEVVFEGDWNEVIVAFNRIEANNDKRESRRHYHIEAAKYEGEKYACEDGGFAEVESSDQPSETERLYQAIRKLPEEQQRLIEALFFEGKSTKEFAAECGVSAGAISQRKKTVLKKIKKLF